MMDAKNLSMRLIIWDQWNQLLAGGKSFNSEKQYM